MANAAAFTRLESATSSAEATVKTRGLSMAAPAYATAVSLLPLVAWRGIPRNDQESRLTGRPFSQVRTLPAGQPPADGGRRDGDLAAGSQFAG